MTTMIEDYYVSQDEQEGAFDAFAESPSLQALAASLVVAGDEFTRDALASMLAQVAEGVSIAFGAPDDFEVVGCKYLELLPILGGLMNASSASRSRALDAFADWQATRAAERQKRLEAYAAAGV